MLGDSQGSNQGVLLGESRDLLLLFVLKRSGLSGDEPRFGKVKARLGQGNPSCRSFLRLKWEKGEKKADTRMTRSLRWLSAPP